MAEVKKTPTTKSVEIETVVEDVVETPAEVVVEDVIVAPEPKKNTPTLGFNEDGVMGSTTTNAEKAKVEKEEVVVESANNKVAIFSSRNLYADGPGKVNIGYNIVSKRHVEFWLKHKGIRLATPDEVAEAFA